MRICTKPTEIFFCTLHSWKYRRLSYPICEHTQIAILIRCDVSPDTRTALLEHVSKPSRLCVLSPRYGRGEPLCHDCPRNIFSSRLTSHYPRSIHDPHIDNSRLQDQKQFPVIQPQGTFLLSSSKQLPGLQHIPRFPAYECWPVFINKLYWTFSLGVLTYEPKLWSDLYRKHYSR